MSCNNLLQSRFYCLIVFDLLYIIFYLYICAFTKIVVLLQLTRLAFRAIDYARLLEISPQQKSRLKRRLSCTNKSLKPFVGLLAVELLYFVFVSSGFSHELTYDYISRSSNSASSWRDFFAKSLSVSAFSASFSTESLVAFSTSLSTTAESASSRSSLLTIFRL